MGWIVGPIANCISTLVISIFLYLKTFIDFFPHKFFNFFGSHRIGSFNCFVESATTNTPRNKQQASKH